MRWLKLVPPALILCGVAFLFIAAPHDAVAAAATFA